MERWRKLTDTVRRTIDQYATRAQFDPIVAADEFLTKLPPEEQERTTAVAAVIEEMGADLPARIGVMGDIALGSGIDLTIAGRGQALTHDERIRIQEAIRIRFQSSGWKFDEGDTRTHFIDMPPKHYSILTQTPTLDIDDIPIPVVTDTPYFNIPTAPTRTMVVLISDQSASEVIDSHVASRTPLAVLV